jgi:hypothetical protein
MTDDAQLLELIVQGDVTAAVQVALAHRAAWVEDSLGYSDMDEHAEEVSIFLQAWLPALPALERLQAAEWAAGQYLLPLVHLDNSFGIGARLYLEAQAAATAELASAYRDFRAFTLGPDAETPSSVADRLEGYAEQLEAMDFDATDGQSP